MNSTFSNWIKRLSTENTPDAGGVSVPTNRHVGSVCRDENSTQVIDFKGVYRQTDKTDIFGGEGGPDAARPGCGQGKNGAAFLSEADLKFWQTAVDEAAVFLGCDETDTQMMQHYLLIDGQDFIIPLHALLVAYDLPICRAREFRRWGGGSKSLEPPRYRPNG